MHRLSSGAIVLALAASGCGTGAPTHDPLVSSAKGLKLVFEMVCMPVVLDGQDFAALADARLMTPMAPATNPSGQSAQTYRLHFTGVTATRWEDGSCTVGAELGDSDKLQAQTLASLAGRGLVMKEGLSGQPAINNGVGSAYCSPEARPLVLGLITPAPHSGKGHALVATLYRASGPAPAVCSRS